MNDKDWQLVPRSDRRFKCAVCGKPIDALTEWLKDGKVTHKDCAAAPQPPEPGPMSLTIEVPKMELLALIRAAQDVTTQTPHATPEQVTKLRRAGEKLDEVSREMRWVREKAKAELALPPEPGRLSGEQDVWIHVATIETYGQVIWQKGGPLYFSPGTKLYEPHRHEWQTQRGGETVCLTCGINKGGQ